MRDLRHLPKLYLCSKPVDMRKAINGLSALIEAELSLSACSGAAFVFVNKARDILKLLYWDKTGFALWHKRLEKERFRWPSFKGDHAEITSQQLRWLLDGYDISKMRPHEKLNYKSVL